MCPPSGLPGSCAGGCHPALGEYTAGIRVFSSLLQTGWEEFPAPGEEKRLELKKGAQIFCSGVYCLLFPVPQSIVCQSNTMLHYLEGHN